MTVVLLFLNDIYPLNDNNRNLLCIIYSGLKEEEEDEDDEEEEH